jgi:F-type H+-transporting ATPase subunit b
MEQLGIQPSLLLAQIVNFSIIAFVLTKILYKPILSMLEKRRKEIQEGLALTEKMREEEEKLKAKEAKILDSARKEARELLEKTKKEAGLLEKQLAEEAHKEAGTIIEKGKNEVESLRASMMKDVQKEAIELAVAMTKRLTSTVLSGENQHALIAKELKKLESVQRT